MPQYVYNGLGQERMAEMLEGQVRNISKGPRFRGTENATTKKRMMEKYQSRIDRETALIEREIAERDKGFDLWGVAGSKASPLALRFEKGVPVQVDEVPKPPENAKPIPEEWRRWCKIQALVKSGTLTEVATETQSAADLADLSGLNAKAAGEMIDGTEDAELLARWAAAETRAGVGKALAEKIDKLTAPAQA